jgi:hypothetical protein
MISVATCSFELVAALLLLHQGKTLPECVTREFVGYFKESLN